MCIRPSGSRRSTSTTAARVPTACASPPGFFEQHAELLAALDALADQLAVARLEDVQRHALGRHEHERQRKEPQPSHVPSVRLWTNCHSFFRTLASVDHVALSSRSIRGYGRRPAEGGRDRSPTLGRGLRDATLAHATVRSRTLPACGAENLRRECRAPSAARRTAPIRETPALGFARERRRRSGTPSSAPRSRRSRPTSPASRSRTSSASSGSTASSSSPRTRGRSRRSPPRSRRWSDAAAGLNRYPDGGAYRLHEALAARHDVALDRGLRRLRRGRLPRHAQPGAARPGRRDRLRLAVVPELRHLRAQAGRGARARAAARAPLRPRRAARRGHAAHEDRLRLPPEQPDRDDEHARRARRLLRARAAGRARRRRPGVLRVRRPARTTPTPSPSTSSAGRNVVVLRTFSKLYGLAGLRVGYAVGPPRDRAPRWRRCAGRST